MSKLSQLLRRGRTRCRQADTTTKQHGLLGQEFAFIHVPKTGGTSVRLALQQYCQSNDHHPHISARCLRECIGTTDYDRRFSFAFVRHPLSWLVSVYHHIRRQPSLAVNLRWQLANWRYVLGHPILSDEMESQPIEDFLDRYLRTWQVAHERDFDAFVEEGAAGHLAVITQSAWIVDDQGKVMIDFVGRFEQLRQHLAFACQRIGLPPVELPHENKGAYTNDWRAFYNARLERLASQWMSHEFRILGYPLQQAGAA